MQLVFVLLTVLLLAVAVFALQNPDRVTLSFLAWKVETSVALLTLGATTAGALIAGLLSLASGLSRWNRRRVAAPAVPPDISPPTGPPSRPGA